MDDPRDRTDADQAVRLAIASHRDGFLKILRRQAGLMVDVEDVLHAALERALLKSHQVKDPARAEAWVGRIVRNALIDELRKRNWIALPEHELEIAAQEHIQPEDDCIDCWCVLVQAEQLKPDYAYMLRRVIVDGAAVTEVAAELGLTANNATVRLHRARKALKERMAVHCGTTDAQSCSDCGCKERGCCPPP